MSYYEITSLMLTGIYDLLTFLLLVFVVHEAVIKPRLPNIAFYLQNLPDDTKKCAETRQLADFVFENRGSEIKNIKITSDPDDIGWRNLGVNDEIKPRKTSEIFQRIIPFLGRNERLQFFWCDLEKNIAIVKMPFKVIIEFDNTIFPFRPRMKRVFKFDFSVFDEVAWGFTGKFDIHNVAQESARIRKELEGIRQSLPDCHP